MTPPDSACETLNDGFRWDGALEAPVRSNRLMAVYRFGWSPDCRTVLGIGTNTDGYALALIIQVSHTPRHVTPVQPEY